MVTAKKSQRWLTISGEISFSIFTFVKRKGRGEKEERKSGKEKKRGKRKYPGKLTFSVFGDLIFA